MSQSEQENQRQGQDSTIENPSSISTEKNKWLLSTKMKKKKIPRNSFYHVWSNKNNNYNNNSQLFRKYPPSFRKATYHQSVLGPAPWQSKTDDCHTYVFFTKKMIKNFQIVSEVLCFFILNHRISFTFNFPNI